MELNKKELKKITYSFNSIASRMMRVTFEEYNIILKKFLAYIDDNEIISEYIKLGAITEYNVGDDWNKVTHVRGYMFGFGPSIEEESFQIYSLLKYILENVKEPQFAFYKIYGERKWQDNIKKFNDRVVLVLIHNIEEYLTRVGIDMGLDEAVTFNVTGGQVNIANDTATINATQNNGTEVNELGDIIRGINDSLSGLSENKREEVAGAIDIIQEELVKAEPKVGKLRLATSTLAQIISIANGAPILVANIQKLIELVAQRIQ